MLRLIFQQLRGKILHKFIGEKEKNMTDLFEDDEVEIIESGEHFADLEVDAEVTEVVGDGTLDARRRLENMLEERRLRDELDDFVDY